MAETELKKRSMTYLFDQPGQEEYYCMACDNKGWVCENHPKMPWDGGDPACCKDSAGMPCECTGLHPSHRHRGKN